MKASYTGEHRINPAGSFEFNLNIEDGASFRLEADLFPFNKASITVMCSDDFDGSATFEIEQGNNKGVSFASGLGSVEIGAGLSSGLFDLSVTGRYLVLKAPKFTISQGSAKITIVGKR